MRYLRLLAVFARVELQFAFEYRANLVLQLFQEMVIVISSLLAVFVLYGHTAAINGWSFAQMVVLLGVFYLIQGANGLIFEASFQRFMEQIRLGTFDFILIKPTNSQFLVSTRYIQVAQVGQLVLGLILVAAGVLQLGEGVGPFQIFAFVVTLVCGLSLVYCLLLVLSTLSFWFVRVDNVLVIFWSFVDAGRFPVDIYPGWLRVTLSSVVPIGIAVTVPAQAIAGRLDAGGLGLMLAATMTTWWAAAWFWRLGVRNYTGASA